MKASQAYILLQQLRDNNINSKWLAEYLDNSQLKTTYANRIGIDVPTWKNCFYALVMGASPDNNKGAIYQCILDHFDGDVAKASAAWRKFRLLTHKFKVAVKKWRNFIYKSKDRKITYRHGGVKYWKNACGMRYKEFGIKEFGNQPKLVAQEDLSNPVKKASDLYKIPKVKRALAAFILQGQEACFIHHLTLLCKKTGIPVYKNEHDGLITGQGNS